MKKVFYAFTFLVIVMVSFISCNNEEEIGGEKKERLGMIEMNVSNITDTTASIELNPSDENVSYYYKIFESTTLQEMSDENIIAIAKADKDFVNSLFKGHQSFNLTDLNPQTAYTAIAFSISNQQTGDLCKIKFTTLEKKEEGISFSIENLKPEYLSVTCTIVPDKSAETYVYYTMEKKWHDEYAKEGENGVIIHAYYGLQNRSVEQGYENIGQYLKKTAMTGTREITINDLKANTEYVLLVFYVDTNITNPTDIKDKNYYSQVFKTLEPTGENLPTVNATPKYTIDENGMVNLTVNIKATNVVAAKYNLMDNATAQSYLEQGITNETLANLFFSLKPEQIKLMLTEYGLDMKWPPLDPVDLYFVMSVKNSEGAVESIGVEIPIE